MLSAAKVAVFDSLGIQKLLRFGVNNNLIFMGVDLYDLWVSADFPLIC
jgi:hypothetical protein